MAKYSRIEWTDATWSPVTGCDPISEGCQNCYAKRMAKRLAGRCGYPADDPFRVTLHPERLNEPLKWKTPRRVFVCSMSDLFHEDVPFEYIHVIWDIIKACPQHTFLILTKRPQRMAEVVNRIYSLERLGWSKGFWDHIWLGVTAENQQRANERIPILLQIPAAVRFVSIEPMLGPVDLTRIGGDWYGNGRINALKGLQNDDTYVHEYNLRWKAKHCGELDWVICGGETGPGARPMHPDWVRNLRNQCQQAGVPFFFKSWGEWIPSYKTGVEFELSKLKDNEVVMSGPGYGIVMKRVGKKKAGRLLDGQIWDEMPLKGADAE